MGLADLVLIRAPRKVSHFGNIGRGRVELVGTVEPLSVLTDPLDGTSAVAIEYRAAPPSLLGIQGTEQPFSAFRVEAHQSVDFVLSDDSGRVLVQIPEGQDDVAAIHEHLSREYGLRLECATRCIRPGDRLGIIGFAEQLERGSPYRSFSYAAVLRAERFWATRGDVR